MIKPPTEEGLATPPTPPTYDGTTLAGAQGRAFSEVDRRMLIRFDVGYLTGGVIFPMRAEDRINWVTVNALKADPIMGPALFPPGVGLDVTVKTPEGLVTVHNFADAVAFTAWFNAALGWAQTIFVVARTLKLAIQAAGTVGEVEAIDLEAGWPS